MASDDITVQILREIRDEIRGTNDRLDATNARLDVHIEATRVGFERVDKRFETLTAETKAGFEDLSRRIMKSEFTLRTEIVESQATQQNARFRDRAEERERLDRCEQAIADIYRRIGPDD